MQWLIKRWILREEPSMPVYRLTSVQYSERIGSPKEWVLDPLTLGSVNLLVGTNATGKTRVVNIINSLARMLLPDDPFRVLNAAYDVHFELDERRLRYVIHVEDGKISKEEVYQDGDRLLERGPGGEGRIFAAEYREAIRFKPPENELAAVVRRDSLQHPFLEPLHDWARSVRYYTFGSTLGRDVLVLPVKGGPEPNERDARQVVGIFRKAIETLGPKFVDALKQDMGSMEYDLEEVDVYPSESARLGVSLIPTDLLVIGVRERGIDGIIEQMEMSQGMFRALSILIQVNYSQMTNRANCILIDDIGEGLDFDRSTRLIELLRQKAMSSSFQLIMTTNDRFVMNHVPLEEWSVLQRSGGRVRVRNYENSREIFEEFKFTGLSNFSFLEMDFLNEPREAEAALHG
jgi:AAA domain, putative AbiEii toxin, Type IV TA system